MAAIIGAIKAKLLPKKTGTFPFVIRWKIKVPTPAVNKATAGSISISNGTNTVAPNATNKNCTPIIILFIGLDVSVKVWFWEEFIGCFFKSS